MIGKPLWTTLLTASWRTIFLAAGCTSQSPIADSPLRATVMVDTLQRYRTMTGWEAVAQAAQGNLGHPGWSVPLAVQGLRSGTYGTSATTAAHKGAELGDHVVGSDGRLQIEMPAAGVLTVYSK